MRKAVGEQGYIDNNAVAFGKEGEKYLFPEKCTACETQIKKNFEHHPQLTRGTCAILIGFLRNDLLADHRSHLKSIATRDDGPAKILHVWGTKDTVVPYEFAPDAVAMNPDRVKLVSPNLGHESIAEDPKQVAQIIIDEFKGE